MSSRLTVLVTGATGFIGHRTAQLLAEQGCRVIGLDRDVNSPLAMQRIDRIVDQLAGFHICDITNGEGLRAVFAKYPFDAVIHLAARTGVRDSLDAPGDYLTTNTLGTLNVLEAMRAYGVGKLVLASTSSVYAGHPIPFREDMAADRPQSPYAASKRAAELLAHTYHQLHGFDVSVLRYFTVYGPLGRPDMAPLKFLRLIQRGEPVPIFGNGSQRRDFTFVDDVARANIAALRQVGCETFNIGAGARPTTVLELVSHLEAAANRRALLQFLPANGTDMAETQADNSKAERVLGWRPSVRLPDGIAEMVAWANATG